MNAIAAHTALDPRLEEITVADAMLAQGLV